MMARPSKRSAESDLDDGDNRSRSSSEDLTSTPPSSSRKRLRISDESIDNDSASTPDTAPSDYEDEFDEDDEVAATQAIREQRAAQKDNGPAECGILESVRLKNFMCHGEYEFKLGPLINFICGGNGSGKSAILTAIVLCLGGKASQTNRGGSLKSFIKNGQDQASITCKLKNQGEGAFMPEDYGDTISIERHFSKQGGSGFKLRSASGRLISSKKGDLDDICDHFGLQIDNPLNVLSQDMARQFITASNAAEKYKFFVKGVQLEQLDQDYRLIQEQLENIQANIEKKRPDIDDLKQRMQKAQAKDDASKKQDGIRRKMQDLRRQIAWVQVQNQEALLAEYVQAIEQADHDIEHAEEQVAELDQVLQASSTTNEQAHAAFEQAKNVLTERQDEKREKEAVRDEAKKETVDSQAEKRTVNEAIKATRLLIDNTLLQIKQEERRILDIQGGGAAERLQAREDAKKRLETALEMLDAHRNQKANIKDQENAAKMEMEIKSQALRKALEEVEKRKQGLNDFLKDQNQLDAAYDRNMPNLVQAIAQEQRFQQRPIGPIGKHVQLLKPEWSSILEKSFGSTLNGFVVMSKEDSHILTSLMRRHNCHVPVLIGNNKPIDTTPHEPDGQFDTVLRVLDIDNELVRKALIIQFSIEQIILVADLTEATQVMYDQGRLHNVKRCFCLNPRNKRNGFSLSYTRSGDMSQDPVHEFVGKPRMRSDNQAQIRMRQEAVEEAKQQSRAVELEKQQAAEAYVKAKHNTGQHIKDEHDLKIESQTWNDKVEELNDLITEDNIEGGKLDALRQGLSEGQEKLGLLEEAYKDAVNSSDDKRKKLSSLQAEVNESDAGILECERELKAAQHAAARADKQRAHDLGEKNQAAARVEDARADRATMEAKRADKEAKIADYTTQASAISARVNVPDGATTESLNAQHEALRLDIERSSRTMGGSSAEIAQAAKAARVAFKRGKKDLENLENLQTKLTASLTERQQRWKKFRSHISVRAKAMFTYLLSERSFRGRLITDHKQKLLELNIEPDITKRSDKGRNARTLSGGEKSFSQICLLLSIWEAMGSPIRCLDEFDVYMDPVNRNLSVTLLVEAARQSVGRQFVLISPGTKSDIKAADDITIREVAAPQRGQRTLNEYTGPAPAVATAA